MEEYLLDILQEARQVLAEADLDELLEDFLAFEETSTGPTVKELFDMLNVSIKD
jgi:hypothetical protein